MHPVAAAQCRLVACARRCLHFFQHTTKQEDLLPALLGCQNAKHIMQSPGLNHALSGRSANSNWMAH